MKRLAKTVYLENGELYATIKGNRVLLATCDIEVEIYEDIHNIKIINANGYNVKKRHISIVLCNEMETTRPIDLDLFDKITCFDLVADFQRKDGVFERLVFDNLIPDELDLDNQWKFEVSQYSDISKKLLSI